MIVAIRKYDPSRKKNEKAFGGGPEGRGGGRPAGLNRNDRPRESGM